MIQEVEDESYAVLMVEREDDESFFDAHEPVVEEIGKATAVAMDLQDDNFETEDGTYQVNMVMGEEMDHGWSKVLMTVDSGADISEPFQYALRTRAGAGSLARAVRAAAELDARTTVLSIDGVGAYDHISHASMLSGLQHTPSLTALLPFVAHFYAEGIP